ncbi:MAG: oligosaccharide flippase family protein [Candidatus Omnitrophica bacterium]|nr:oligosaccharide flippase family protein [Candidatus Omnitrophota bacterium]
MNNYPSHNKDFLATKAGIFLFLDFLAGGILGWVLQMFLSRTLGPAGYGKLALVNTIFLIFAGIFTPGIAMAVTRHVAISSEPKKVLISAIRIEIAVDIILYIIYYSFIDTICRVLSIIELKPYFIILGTMILARGLTSVAIGYFNGIFNFSKCFKINFSYNISRLIFCVVFFYLGLGFLGIILGFMVAELVAFITSVFYVELTRGISSGLQDNSYKKLLYLAFPIWLLGFSNFFIKRIDILCIRYLLVNYNFVGFYEAAYRIFELIITFLSLTHASLLPQLSSALENKDTAYAQLILERSVRYCFLLATPLCFLVAINSKFILSIVFSYKFSEGYQVLSILSLSWILLSILYILNFILVVREKMWVVIKLFPLLFLLNILLNFAFIPIWGISGAAIASMIVLFIAELLVFLIAYKNNLFPVKKIMWLSRNTLKNVIMSILLAVLVSTLVHSPDAWFNFIFKTSTVLIIYVCLLFILKEVNNDDLNIVKAIAKKLKLIKG